MDHCAPTYFVMGDGGNEEGPSNYTGHTDQVMSAPLQSRPCRDWPTPRAPGFPILIESAPEPCCCSQDWSAYRESSFGHAILDFTDANTAQFTWLRNQDPLNGTPADKVSTWVPSGSAWLRS